MTVLPPAASSVGFNVMSDLRQYEIRKVRDFACSYLEISPLSLQLEMWDEENYEIIVIHINI